MTTFMGWLNDQRKRDDPVGWFASYWHKLENHPRLSSPTSIADHLNERGLMTGPVQENYDITLREYRAMRNQTAIAAVESETGRPVLPPDPQAPPGMPETHVTISEPVQITGGLGGAGSPHTKDGSYGVVPPKERAAPENAYAGWPRSLLMQILDNQKLIMARLGIPDPETGGPAQDGWQEMYDMADLSAEA